MEQSFTECLNKNTKPNAKEAWGKLDKTMRVGKLVEWVDSVYGPQHDLTVEQIAKCKTCLLDAHDKKKLTRVKEIVYNREEETITSIPCLSFNSTLNNYFVVGEKRVSTLKSLPNITKKVKLKKPKSATTDVQVK
jgi:hypothetical protein